MKKLFIVKIGTTHSDTKRRLGDFDDWTAAAVGETNLPIGIVDAEHGAPLPEATHCAGIIVTGSHAMVTERLPWSCRMEQWIPTLLDANVPYFGICYGHQLLAQAMGGKIGHHPKGAEVGTVDIRLLLTCANDPVFRFFPNNFPAHVFHSQTISCLPPGAVCLAESNHEHHHAFRVGGSAWGVQFHPEYNTEIMRSYIWEDAKALDELGMDVSTMLENVAETPVTAKIIKRFVRFVQKRVAET